MAAGYTGSHRDPRFVAALLSESAAAHSVGGVLWKKDGPKHVGTIEVVVDQMEVGEARLVMTANKFRPSEPSIAYVADGGWIRRLCLNTEHRPFLGTHKHRLDARGEVPYEPDDIPDVPLSRETDPHRYLEVVQAFAAECAIALGSDFVWTDPWGGE